VDLDSRVAAGPRSVGFSLPIAPLEGTGGLPQALFARQVLEMGGCVVASAQVERHGEELTLEEAEELLGESLQASIDQRGLREALLRSGQGDPILLRRLGGDFLVLVAVRGAAGARELAASLGELVSTEGHPRDIRVPIAFWSGGGGDGVFGGPEPRWRRLALPGFSEIADNYPPPVRGGLAELFAFPSGDALPGRLALWHGPPGTGKTWALRALAREWAGWCDVHYVTDPERLLGGDAGYMLAVLASRSDAPRHDLDDEEPAAHGRARECWRLLVLEDAGELLGVAAPTEVGRGFARLLNISDGLLGQGSRALILVTTNEPLGKLHPAALRPGRAMASLEFAPLRAPDANAWLARQGADHRVDSPTTIAELHAILAGGSPAPTPTPPRTSMGFARAARE
jgi:hypothetical protein